LLLAYLALVDEWRKFPDVDPRLPKDLPPNWIGHHATEVFLSLRARWQPDARERWAQITDLTAGGEPAP
jgi:phenylacetic acid degradation operon negative regulatory protein